jgi:hypothetical protein
VKHAGSIKQMVNDNIAPYEVILLKNASGRATKYVQSSGFGDWKNSRCIIIAIVNKKRATPISVAYSIFVSRIAIVSCVAQPGGNAVSILPCSWACSSA